MNISIDYSINFNFIHILVVFIHKNGLTLKTISGTL